MLGVHYMAHHTNPTIKTCSNFEVVKHVETILTSLYSCFSSFTECTVEFQKCTTCLEFKGKNILTNIKTC